ncbi:MAG: branched-chain amino acid ABC transporter permease [Nitrospirae bacterium]|nr:branched-chain amino acid ABC transporter permease [Nitrospirota bacterium]
MELFLQQIVNGLTVGAVYALIALGYTMVYGILQLINFAHGEIYMLGAYLGIIILAFLTAAGLTAVSLPLAILLTIIAAGAICAAYGATMEKVAYKPLRDAPRLAPLISAMGVSIFLQNYVMLTQGATDKVFPGIIPAAGVTVYGVEITYLQIFIMAASVVLMAGLHIFIMKTRMGRAMRATALDMKMAGLVGVNTDSVISVTFIVGSFLAAVAGVMVAMYYGLVNFSIGYLAGMKAFTAAVLGGIGNVPGAMLGGVLLGVLESLGAGYLWPEYKDAFAFLVLVLILIVRPQGLLGERVPDKV